MEKVRNNDPRQEGRPMTNSISFRLERETAEKFDAICFREGMSKSAMMKRLLRQFVEENYDD